MCLSIMNSFFPRENPNMTKITLFNVILFKKSMSHHCKMILRMKAFLSPTLPVLKLTMVDGIIVLNSSPLTTVIIHPHPAIHTVVPTTVGRVLFHAPTHQCWDHVSCLSNRTTKMAISQLQACLHLGPGRSGPAKPSTQWSNHRQITDP